MTSWKTGWVLALALGLSSSAMATTATVVNASSPEAASRVPELLTYQQIMSLSPAKREAYLQGVRQMLVELAQFAKEKGDDMVAGRTRDLEGRFLALQAFLSVAEAEQANSLELPAPQAAGRPADNASAAAAVPKAQDAVPHFVNTGWLSENWKCVPSKAGERNRSVDFSTVVGTCVTKKLGSKDECEDGTVEAKIKNNSAPRGTAKSVRYCVPKASWDLLPEGRRTALSSDNGADDVSPAFSRIFRNWDKPGTPTGRDVTFAKNVTVSESGAPIVAPTADKVVTCDAGYFSCEEPWSVRRKKYYDDPTIDSCIFSGNASTFIEGQKRPGRCKPVTSLKLSATGPEFACADRGTTLCNPLVFSVAKDGSPFCVLAKANATRECNAASSQENRTLDFLGQNIAGMQESWMKFREGFNKLCKTNEVSRKFHCEECRIMSERLVQLNASATGTPCGDLKEASAMPTAPAAAPAGGARRAE